jgi:hypothetical protein
MGYRIWIHTWVAREEVFENRDSAELFRLKLTASNPRLGAGDVRVIPERVALAPPSAGTETVA